MFYIVLFVTGLVMVNYRFLVIYVPHLSDFYTHSVSVNGVN